MVATTGSSCSVTTSKSSPSGGGGGGGGGTRTVKPPAKTTSRTTPPPKPVGPAGVETCGSVASGLGCALHAHGFQPGEVVRYSIDTGDGVAKGPSSKYADSQGDVDASWALAPGPATVTVTFRGEDSGITASGTWTVN